MSKKVSFTIVERATIGVPDFEKVVKKMEQQVILRGQSMSTLNNYIRRIALISLHFNRLPHEIEEEEINEYLVALARNPKSPSRSSFKHMVYGLRYYYRLLGMNKKAIALPSLKRDTKLPIILNRKELKELFAAPKLLKHRIVLSLVYSAGLRGQEVINLKQSDIDFERMTIHIRQSKYKKDRIVPLSPSVAMGLKKYMKAENPHIWLFNGKELGGQYSVRGLGWLVRETLKKTTIEKQVNLHSLRHSYATHLLEDGMNIVTLKELLGHAQITTTRKLRKLDRLTGFDTHIQKAYKKDWVVYCEAPLSGVKQIIRYLGQYTHRIAISNQRILDIADGEVVFHAKDYRDNGTVKKTRLCGEEFLRRFLQHVLPRGFVRIRRYGIYHPTVKRNLSLQFVEEQSGFDKLMTQADQEDGNVGQGTPSVEHRICPCCKKGKMIRVREIPRIRSPPGHLPSILKSYLL